MNPQLVASEVVPASSSQSLDSSRAGPGARIPAARWNSPNGCAAGTAPRRSAVVDSPVGRRLRRGCAGDVRDRRLGSGRPDPSAPPVGHHRASDRSAWNGRRRYARRCGVAGATGRCRRQPGAGCGQPSHGGCGCRDVGVRGRHLPGDVRRSWLRLRAARRGRRRGRLSPVDPKRSGKRCSIPALMAMTCAR